jgi:hypothetical protein
MKKKVTHFRIKPEDRTKMGKARKLVLVSHMADGSSVYKTIAYENSDDVSSYLSGLGINVTSVARLSLRE